MPEQDWNGFPDDTVLADSDSLLVMRGAGGVNIPGSAIIKRESNGRVVSTGPSTETSTLANAVTNAALLLKPFSGSAWGLAFGSLTGSIMSIQGVDSSGSGFRDIAINALGGFVGVGVTPTCLLHVRTAVDTTKALIGGITKAVRINTTAADARVEGVSHDNASFQPLVIGGSFVSMSESGSITFNFSGGHLLPSTDNIRDLGSGALRMRVIYAGTGAINTSDEREKKNIGDIPDAWLDAWGRVNWQRFKFKGGSRWHTGLVAQQVHAAFEAEGLDAFEIGLCCFDKWDEVREPIFENVKKTRKVKRETGELTSGGKPKFETVEEEFEETVDTGETRVTLEAGDRWGLRYDECFAIEAAWQRRELARLSAKLEALSQ